MAAAGGGGGGGVSCPTVSLQCAICLDELHKPKALPCLHTFCLSCLQRHITSTVKTRSNKLTCPECRSKCLPPNPKRPVEAWAAQFPTNFHLLNVIEASQQQHHSSGGYHGQRRSRASTFAQRLTEARTFVDSTLLDLGTKQQRVSAMRSHVTHAWNKSKDQLHEVFTDLESALKERREELVQKLDEGYVENTQCLFSREDRIITHIKQLRQCSDEITKLITGEKENSSLGLTNIEQQLDQTRQDIMEEAPLEDKPYSAMIINPENIVSIISGISTLGSFRTDCPTEGTDQEPTSSPNPRITMSEANTNSNRNTQHDGNLTTANAPPRRSSAVTQSLPLESTPVPQLKPAFVSSCSLVFEGDKKEPFVTGVCNVSGLLLLTDVNNRCVKALGLPQDSQDNVKRGSLSLQSDPLCISSLGCGQAVVGSERCVYVLKVHQGVKMAVQNVVETNKCYYGIAALPEGNTVAACTDQPAGVDVVDLKTCKVIRTLSKDPINHTPLFTSPFYLTALPQGRLLVSDKDNTPPITCVTTTGEVIYRFISEVPSDAGPGKLTWPLGVCGCWFGTALVVDAAQHAVFHLSADGRVARKVLQNSVTLKSPSALCFSQSSESLYVVSDKGQMLLVYKLERSCE